MLYFWVGVTIHTLSKKITKKETRETHSNKSMATIKKTFFLTKSVESKKTIRPTCYVISSTRRRELVRLLEARHSSRIRETNLHISVAQFCCLHSCKLNSVLRVDLRVPTFSFGGISAYSTRKVLEDKSFPLPLETHTEIISNFYTFLVSSLRNTSRLHAVLPFHSNCALVWKSNFPLGL